MCALVHLCLCNVSFHIIAGICLSSVLALAMLFSVAQMRSGRVTLHKLSLVPDGSLLCIITTDVMQNRLKFL